MLFTPNPGSFLLSPFLKNTDFLPQEGSKAAPCIFCSESMNQWQLHPRNSPEGFADPHPKPACEQGRAPVSPRHRGVTAGTISDTARGLQEATDDRGGKEPCPVHTVSVSALSNALHRIPPPASPCQSAGELLCSLGLHSFL